MCTQLAIAYLLNQLAGDFGEVLVSSKSTS
jgi:hypothetical protein